MSAGTGRRILITNNTLAAPAGTEMYVRDLAVALMKRGHFPVVYSSQLGQVAEELRGQAVPVLSDLAALREPPDVIHGQHHLDAMVAYLRYPDVPAVHVCHGWVPWEELPVVFPSIRRYVAVDRLCRERLLTTPGVDPDRVEVLPNHVDLNRFRPRDPLPPRPARALILSNYATESNYAAVVERVCATAGIAVDVVGSGVHRATATPEEILGGYDVVFAKGRAALEALAVGCAVVIADTTGCGGMVTSANVALSRSDNFGMRTMLRQEVTAESIAAALAGYDPDDAAAVSQWIRENADLPVMIDRWEQIYAELEAEPFEKPDPAECLRAASEHLRSMGPWVKALQGDRWRAAAAEHDVRTARAAQAALIGEIAELQDRIAALQEELSVLQQEPVALAAELTEARRESERQRLRADELADDLAALQATKAMRAARRVWRVRERLAGGRRAPDIPPRV